MEAGGNNLLILKSDDAVLLILEGVDSILY